MRCLFYFVYNNYTMEKIIVQRREFEILETLSDNSFKVQRKKKVFFLKQFKNYGDFSMFIERRKLFLNNGVRCPKTIYKDKNNLSVVTEFIEGENVLEMLYKAPLDESVYKSIFLLCYLARLAKMMPDFDPSNYLFTTGGKLYYMSLKYDKYDEKNNFVQKGIKLWFYTKEFSSLLLEKGHQIDKSRLKEDYAINKEIVLMTVKYYN